MPQEKARNRQMLFYHTASYVHGTKFKQLFHSGGQFPAAYSGEVIEGKEVKVLGQVTWQAVELIQHPVGHTHTHWSCSSLQLMAFFFLFKFSVNLINAKRKTSYSLEKRQVLKRFFM